MTNPTHLRLALAGLLLAASALPVAAQTKAAATSMSGTSSGITSPTSTGMNSAGTGINSGMTTSAMTGSTATTANTTAGTNFTPSTNWNTESQYWQNTYSTRPYYNKNTNYTTYAPAYQYGVSAYRQYGGKPYQNINTAQLQAGWNQSRGTSTLSWAQAQAASRDAYDRLYNSHANTTASTPNNVVQ